ncbi:MAG: hypothetical protein V3U65_19610 [Granulosicoccaceae bacterium]
MQLQKFVGESMPVVLGTLKDALGSDAIILANRRVGNHIEIIATGTLDETSIDNAELFDASDHVNLPAAAKNDNEPSSDNSAQRVDVNEDAIAEQSANISEGNEPSNGPSNDEVTANGEDESTPSVNQAPEVVHTEPEEQALKPSTEIVAEENDDMVAADTREENNTALAESIANQLSGEVERNLLQFHTTMNQRLSQLEVNLWGEKDPVKSKHLQTLLEIGLGAELAVALVSRVDASRSYEEALRLSLIDLANTLPVASDSTLTRNGVTFVTGPSGAGKTTALLKLAAQKMALSGADSVVMICADAKRIGVFESLAAHGNSLGVSVVCASTQRELQELILFYANKELVLVDQPFQNEFIDLEIPEDDVVDINGRSVRHLLVLPATVQSSVAQGVVSQYNNHPSTRCVITNLDQPCRVGELFTTLIRHNLTVAYWSDCSDIQKPLNRASAPTLVATAMAMAKRLMPTEDERYLMDLIHPRFSASVMPMLRGSL